MTMYLQVLEELDPLGVVRQDAGVEHVGVGQDDVAAGPDGLAGVLGRVAVVGEDADLLGQAPLIVSSSSARWSLARALVGKR